jgi:hypothetical protein
MLTFLAGLAWWSRYVESSVPHEAELQTVQERAGKISDSKRRELLELLDRIVAYEHYYRSVYGHFTKFISRIGYVLPRAVTDYFEIRVVEASSDRLLITALSEIDGKTVDLISIDHEYQLHSNFAVPLPRPEFLRAHAMKHLRVLREADENRLPEEHGIFTGYFRFEVKRDSKDRKIAFASGLKPPVSGVELELGIDAGGNDLLLSALEEDLDDPSLPRRTGQQQALGNVMSTLEEAYLAQRIFRGEIGRSAKSWTELSRIANFRFEGKAQYGVKHVPFGDTGPAPEIEAALEGSWVALEAFRGGGDVRNAQKALGASEFSAQGSEGDLTELSLRQKSGNGPLPGDRKGASGAGQ